LIPPALGTTNTLSILSGAVIPPPSRRPYIPLLQHDNIVDESDINSDFELIDQLGPLPTSAASVELRLLTAFNMAFLFGRNKQRSSLDLCRSTRELLHKLEGSRDERSLPRIEEELARNLGQMKLVLQGTAGEDYRHNRRFSATDFSVEVETSPQHVYQLVHLLMTEDVLFLIAKSIHSLPFETRKDAQVIFSNLFRYRPDHPSQQQDPPILQYVVNKRPDLITVLCNGYDHRESAMFCGGILREALKHDSVCALILYDEPAENGRSKGLHGVDPNIPASGKGVFWKFFEWIDKGAFEVSADAFSTFRVSPSTLTFPMLLPMTD